MFTDETIMIQPASSRMPMMAPFISSDLYASGPEDHDHAGKRCVVIRPAEPQSTRYEPDLRAMKNVAVKPSGIGPCRYQHDHHCVFMTGFLPCFFDPLSDLGIGRIAEDYVPPHGFFRPSCSIVK